MRIAKVAIVLACLAFVGSAFSSEASASSVSLAQRMYGKRILLISAHPDDESLFAPLMAEACRFNGATCHLVAAAEADSMGCIRTIGLDDTVKCSSMRRLETAASAVNINSTYEFYGWRDLFYTWNDAGLERNINAWARDAGGHAELVARIRRTLDSFKPDFLIGFDPRHGTTCHPGHRAVILLSLEAVDQLPVKQRPEIWLETDFAVPTTAPPDLAAVTDLYGIVRWPNDKVATTWYDANTKFPDGRTGWDYLVDAMRLNGTQFPEVATGKALVNPPTEYRRIPFVRLSDIDPRQKRMCETYTPDFPYTDLKGKNSG